MKRWLIAVVGLITIMVMVGACAPAPEKVMTPEEFYRGRVVTMMVTSHPGGGWDTWGRTIAPAFAKQIGAKIVVENMGAGAGWVGNNYPYTRAPRDGSFIWMCPTSKIIMNELFELGEPVKFKSVAEFPLVGAFAVDFNKNSVIVVNPEAPYDTLWDLVGAKDLKSGDSSIMSTTGLQAAGLAQCLGLQDFRLIVGIPGTAEINIALFRGELDIVVAPLDATLGMLEGGMLKMVGQYGYRNECLWEPGRHLPALAEVALPGTEKWIDYYDLIAGVSRGVATPPGVPQDRLEFLAAAFERMYQSPDFIEAANKRLLEISRPLSGEEASLMIMECTTIPKSELDYIKTTWLAYEW